MRMERRSNATGADWHSIAHLVIPIVFLTTNAPSTSFGQVRPVEVTAGIRMDLARFARQHLGDPIRGRVLFMDRKGLGCVECHRARAEGGDVGPDLSDVGAKYDRAQLIESVLEPARQIVEGYRPTIIATFDGRITSGLVKSESSERLELVNAERQRISVRKNDIEVRKVGETSLMPDNLADTLAPESFADLIAFLASLRSSRQPSPGSDVIAPLALPPGFSARVVADGLTGATALEVTPDGRVLICEQTGTLRVVDHDALVSEPLLTLKVDSDWERGLIGVAVDRRDLKREHVYVCYVARDPFPHHRISRFRVDGRRAQPDSETILLEGDDQRKLGGSVPAGHQGGAIHFGEDGKLYVAVGEQTAGQPAQEMNTLLGKILRINADGAIPEDNPFCASASGKYRAIWALGLRNPFTFAIQPGTGRIFINDVGGVAEEVNEGFAGANYGWPTIEHGPTKDRRFRGPIHSYPTASIAGGAFAPAGRRVVLPEEFQSKYFFMDFVKGWVNTLDADHSERVTTFATGLGRPVDLRFNDDGTLYILLRDAWVKDRDFRPKTGRLIRITYRKP
jgi:putative heme-binding domain-containing protein